jgi:hypothetical protein
MPTPLLLAMIGLVDRWHDPAECLPDHVDLASRLGGSQD